MTYGQRQVDTLYKVSRVLLLILKLEIDEFNRVIARTYSSVHNFGATIFPKTDAYRDGY